MGKRATGRKLAMQALYQAELRAEDIDVIFDHFFDEKDYEAETKSWAMELAKGAWAEREHCDQIITDYAIDWDLSRMNPIDKSTLRLAIYEIKFANTPYKVAVNEAIEIAKRYSTDESPKFVNGILGNYVKEACSPE